MDRVQRKRTVKRTRYHILIAACLVIFSLTSTQASAQSDEIFYCKSEDEKTFVNLKENWLAEDEAHNRATAPICKLKEGELINPKNTDDFKPIEFRTIYLKCRERVARNKPYSELLISFEEGDPMTFMEINRSATKLNFSTWGWGSRKLYISGGISIHEGFKQSVTRRNSIMPLEFLNKLYETGIIEYYTEHWHGKFKGTWKVNDADVIKRCLLKW
jgi:hypothetical protein